MSSAIVERLQSIPFFRRVALPDIRRSAPFWEVRTLGVGEVLWEQGTAASALGVVVDGTLAARVDNTEVGVIRTGELVGEVGAFFAGARRSATLVSGGVSILLTLDMEGLRTLRQQGSGVYDALLEQALLTLTRRIRTTDLQIAKLAHGDRPQPVKSEPSTLLRIWRVFRPGGPSGPCPPIEPLLQRQAGLMDAHGEMLSALAQAFEAEAVEEGKILCMEGEVGASAYLVADGKVEVVRNVRGNQAELLATLGPGDLFGINTLVEKGTRTASCVAGTAGWVYRIDQDRMRGLGTVVARLWRESMLGALSTQLRNANNVLHRLNGGKTILVPESDFQNLLLASGYLEGLQVAEGELDQVQVVYTDEQKRNPKNRSVRDSD